MAEDKIEIKMPTLADIFNNTDSALRAYCLLEQVVCSDTISVEYKQDALRKFSETLTSHAANSGASAVIEWVREQPYTGEE